MDAPLKPPSGGRAGTRGVRNSGIRRMIKEALIIVSLGAALGLSVNGVRFGGLSLISRPTAEAVPSPPVAGVTGISLAEALDRYREGKALFLDARSQEAYRRGHIQGALSLPDHAFEQTLDRIVESLEAHEAFITYCDGEDCPLGRSLAEKLHRMGFQRVAYMTGTLTEWRSRGLPVGRGEAP
jgi:rhodanese-related sulfurtransferase